MNKLEQKFSKDGFEVTLSVNEESLSIFAEEIESSDFDTFSYTVSSDSNKNILELTSGICQNIEDLQITLEEAFADEVSETKVSIKLEEKTVKLIIIQDPKPGSKKKPRSFELDLNLNETDEMEKINRKLTGLISKTQYLERCNKELMEKLQIHSGSLCFYKDIT